MPYLDVRKDARNRAKPNRSQRRFHTCPYAWGHAPRVTALPGKLRETSGQRSTGTYWNRKHAAEPGELSREP
eukprot:8064507-Pyramimonas_sp.AAC.1